MMACRDALDAANYDHRKDVIMTKQIAPTALASDDKLVWTAPVVDIMKADSAETGPSILTDAGLSAS